MIIVKARRQGYFGSKIREVGEKFSIPSVEQFSMGISGRKGYERLGWMELVSISKDHEEPTPELANKLKEIIKKEKDMKKEEIEQSDDLDSFETVGLDDIDLDEPEPEPELELESVDNEATIEDNDPDVI